MAKLSDQNIFADRFENPARRRLLLGAAAAAATGCAYAFDFENLLPMEPQELTKRVEDELVRRNGTKPHQTPPQSPSPPKEEQLPAQAVNAGMPLQPTNVNSAESVSARLKIEANPELVADLTFTAPLPSAAVEAYGKIKGFMSNSLNDLGGFFGSAGLPKRKEVRTIIDALAPKDQAQVVGNILLYVRSRATLGEGGQLYPPGSQVGSVSAILALIPEAENVTYKFTLQEINQREAGRSYKVAGDLTAFLMSNVLAPSVSTASGLNAAGELQRMVVPKLIATDRTGRTFAEAAIVGGRTIGSRNPKSVSR